MHVVTLRDKARSDFIWSISEQEYCVLLFLLARLGPALQTTLVWEAVEPCRQPRFPVVYNCVTWRFSVVQSVSHTRLLETPWTAACQVSLSFAVWSLLKLRFIESVMPSNHLILCRPLLLSSVFSSIRVFCNEPALLILPKYWSFSFSISPSSEHSGLISFRIDWFGLQGLVAAQWAFPNSLFLCLSSYFTQVAKSYRTEWLTLFSVLLNP